jgi:hypothetical protein
VDKNPLAVELAKLSLWLTTFAGDRPLGFLDHHLKCGDSLVGARVEDLGSPPPVILNHRRNNRVAEGQLNLFAHLLSERLPVVMGKVMEIVSRESDSYASIRAKEAADRAVQRLKGPFEAVANLWLSAYFGHEYEPHVYQEALDWIHEPATLFMMDEVLEAEAMAEARCFFHWELVFPEVFFDGYGQPLSEEERGFDAVIGNPPYVATAGIAEVYRAYFRNTCKTSGKEMNTFALFTEAGIAWLNDGGCFSFIVPDSFLNVRSYASLRDYILAHCRVVRLAEIPGGAFAEAVLGKNAIFVLRKEEDAKIRRANMVHIDRYLPERGVVEIDRLVQNRYEDFPDTAFVLSKSLSDLFDKIRQDLPTLDIITDLRDGIKTGDNARFVTDTPHGPRYKRLLTNSDIERYGYQYAGLYILYDRALLDGPRDEAIFLAEEKIILRQTGDRIIATLDRDRFYTLDNTHLILSQQPLYDLRYILALLNGTMIDFIYQIIAQETDRVYAQVRIANLAKLPIRCIAFTTPEDERARLLEEAQGLYEAGEYDALLAFAEARLAADPEEADVVHDVLAYLAERMMALKRQEQQQIDAFMLDLEGVTDAETFEALSEHGKWESSLWKAEACRPFVDEESRTTRHLDESVGWNEDCFKAFVKMLAGRVTNLSDVIAVYRRHHSDVQALLQRIGETDRLIDQMVYQLYGLTEEEIALVSYSDVVEGKEG